MIFSRALLIEAIEPFREPQALRLALLGFAAGLPILLVFGSLSFWLGEAGIDRATIGFVSWVGFAYSLKFLWAPIVDSVQLPWLSRRFGRRRGWLLLAQFGVIASLILMALSNPTEALGPLICGALATAFFSATQDIVVDAYRIECAPADRQAALAATYMTGYRLGMIVAGAGALYIASVFDPDEEVYHYAPWRISYLCMAAVMMVGVLTTLFVPEPDTRRRMVANRDGGFFGWFSDAVAAPFTDFFRRHGSTALLVLAVIATYRISDVVLGVIANVFYEERGFSKAQVASVAKVFGVLMTLLGAFLGGALAPRLGVSRLLLLGAVLVSITNLLFAWLAGQEPTTLNLMLVISADNLSGGLATASFVAYLSALTNIQFSATQFALFSSLMTVVPKFFAGWSGWLVDQVGYSSFFVACAALGVPVIVLLFLLRRVTNVETGHGSQR